MRIRRRPQAQALIPSPYPLPAHQQASDPSTAPSQPPPPNQPHWLPRYQEELHLYSTNADLPGDEPSPPARRAAPLPPSHPQIMFDICNRPPPLGAFLCSAFFCCRGDNVVGRSSEGRGGGGGAQRRQGAADADGHGSLENGHRDQHEWPATNAAGERPVNGSVMPAMPLAASTVPLNAKEGTIKSDGPKRRRGPAVLLEGSRCSRVNGRGWRCSQPTLVGYSLCEHHLGKGRQSRSGRSAAGVPKLGRTEPAANSSRKNAVATAPEPAAAQLTAGGQFD